MSTGVIVAFVVGLVLGLLIAWYFCQRKVGELQAALEQKDRRLRELEAKAEVAAPTRGQGAQILAAKAEPDDLKRIEGIGPKIAQLLQNAGITTFQQLADADVARLEQILADENLSMADPATWPEQARLAAAGNWDALEKLQDELKGGRRA